MAEEFQKGIAGILEKLSKMKEPEENKTTENQKFMTDVELKEQSPSLERGEMSLEEYQAGRDEAIKDFIMKLRGMGISDEKITELVIKQFGENRASGGRAGFDKGGGEFSDAKQMLFNKKYIELLKEYSEAGLPNADSRALKDAAEFVREFKSFGGRAGYQEGGVTESRVLPPEFIEAAQKTYLTDLSRQAGIPSITTAVQQQPGETAEQFANRQAQAQQFNITRAGMAELAPQVAAQDPLQAAAYQQAVDPTTGLGSFQPFLAKAGTAADAATALTGAGAGTGAGTIAEYTSPFQQQVIDTTLAEFDKQRQAQQNQLAARTLGVPGAFGGGREGVQRAEFQAASDLNRSRLLADLQQRGFESASQRRQQDLANQMGIANLQQGLGGAAQDFSRAQISGLGTLGSQQQAQTQAVLDAQRQAAAMAVQDPRDRLAMFGQGITGLTPGAGTVQIAPTQAEQASGASPLMTALGLGLAGADIYGRIFGAKR